MTIRTLSALAVSSAVVLGTATSGLTLETTRTVSISASGDVLAHNTLYLAARTSDGYNFNPQLKALRPLLTADINICHLETPLTTGAPSGYPRFATPYQLAYTLKSVGFDGCSVASNHTLDIGEKGVFTTLKELRKQSLKTAGARIREDGTSVAWYTTTDGLRVAQLAYTYGFNGLSLPADKPWLANRISTYAIKSAAKAATAAGADVVIVSLHWGVEYSDSASTDQKNLAAQLTKSPHIDAIIGHHSHVIQNAALVNGKPVIYGMGNLWSGQGPWADQPYGQHGVIVTLNFSVDGSGVRFTNGSYIPTLTQPRTWDVLPAVAVNRADQKAEACDAIRNVAAHLSQVLTGPRKCR